MAGVHTHRAFLLCNYLLLGASSGCIFLTLSLRLLPSPCGLLLVFLHALTAVLAAAAAACSGSFTSTGAGGATHYTAHTASAVLTAIFQGAAALLAFTRTGDFLAELRSYVREEDGEVILRLVGGLGAAVFVLEWAALALAFALRLGDDGQEDEHADGGYAKSWQSGYHV